MQKNVASQKFIVFAFDSTTNLPKTGDAANITAYIAKDFGSVTVLGDTSATEMDATNAKGYYLFDGTQAESNADIILVSGKSSTANIVVIGAPSAIFTTPASFTSSVAQTGDTYARLGAPAGASIAADLAEIEAETDGIAAISTATPLTAAQIATGVWQDATAGDFTAANSIGKSVMNGVALGTGLTINAYTGNTVQTGDAYARLGAPAGASIAADLAEIEGETDTILTNTTGITFTVANQVDVNVVDWKGATAPAMTGDAFARLGAPVGASISADIAEVEGETDTLIAGVNVTSLNGDSTSAANIAKTTRAIGRATASGVPTTTSIPTSACTPAGAAADQFKTRIITFDADTTTTALRGQATDITASTNAATPTFTVTALTTAPVSGDTFSIT